MTLLTHAHLLDRYGPLLTESQLGEVLHLAPGTLRKKVLAHELCSCIIQIKEARQTAKPAPRGTGARSRK